MGRFCTVMRRRRSERIAAIEKARREERIRFGETVYLLEPNVKRSEGGLRDLQLLRWIAAVRYGTPEPDQLCSRGLLSRGDFEALERATEFLLWLRNEMHFHAAKPSDVLNRSEQVRIAGRLGYQAPSGLLPVEQFMRDYFLHTDQVSHVVTRFLARARSARRLSRLASLLLGHWVHGGFRVGPRQILVTARGRNRLRGNLEGIMQLVDLANLYDKPIDPDTWEAVRREAAGLPEAVSPEACRRFRSLLAHPARLGELLRGLHEARLLERFIPAFVHARGLLQFNQYQKYTVDEHCFQAVDEAVQLEFDPGPLGRVYRRLGRKHVLHLALLTHDLGKGYPENHLEAGLQIADQTAGRLRLEARDAEDLKFLVHQHLLMNHLAFRRDTGDEQMIVRFAVQVGSPELLGMLYVLTACDMAAVGPDAWNGWKAEVVTDLYQRTMQHLAADSPAVHPEQQLRKRRESVRAWLGPDKDQPWFVRQVESLPPTYLGGTPPGQIAADLRLLRRLGPDEVDTQAAYQPDTETVQFTIATREEVAPGIFHKLTGALSSQGLEILSAEINTLADGLVIDRFRVFDPDYAGCPPPERVERVRRALVESLRAASGEAPSFRRIWRVGGHRQPTLEVAQNRVRADNSTSEAYTIFDIFAVDRPGLLYAIARTLFQAGLSVWRARIGTYLDQVVDVFYVTDQEGKKVEDQARLDEICGRLLEVVESAKEA
jgi:[protein-PII] uridylyltransferase